MAGFTCIGWFICELNINQLLKPRLLPRPLTPGNVFFSCKFFCASTAASLVLNVTNAHPAERQRERERGGERGRERERGGREREREKERERERERERGRERGREREGGRER